MGSLAVSAIYSLCWLIIFSAKFAAKADENVVEVKDCNQSTHNLTLSFDNKGDQDYIEKLIQFPVLFQDFKKWKDGKVNPELEG